MKIHEYNEMMSYLTRPPAKVQTASLMDEYLGDQLDYQKAVEEGFQGSEEEFRQWKSMRETSAQGGRIGFYKGMSANRAPKKIKLKGPDVFKPTGYKKDGTPKYDTKSIKELDPNFKGRFEGPGLKKPVSFYQGSKKFADITEEAIRVRNAIILENGNIANLQTLGNLADIQSSGKTNPRRTREALALAVDIFPEIANFKFITERYKGFSQTGEIVRSLNMIVDTIKASQNSVAAGKLNEKLIHFLPDNMGFFYKAPGKATEIGRLLKKNEKPMKGNVGGKRKIYSANVYNKMYRLNNDEIKYITDRITEETGNSFTKKDYNNLIDEVKNFRSGIGQELRIAKVNEKTYKEIVDLADDDIIQNLLKGDLDRPTQTKLLERATKLVGGDASIASRRLFQMAEAMSDTTNEYKNLGIELNNNKANKIIATGKEIGGVNNRYGMSSVLYDYYGNVVDKALGATEGRTFIGKYQTQIKNLLDKGQSPDEIFSLTASARRGLSPYAIFTQNLKTQVNSAIKGAYIDGALSRTHKKLQNIFKGRKYNQLNAKDKKAVNDLVETFEKTKANALNKPTNPTAVKNGAKPIYLTAAEKKNIQLPEFDLKNPPSKSISNYKNFDKNLQSAFDKSYNTVGYSMKVPKEFKTQKELINFLKNAPIPNRAKVLLFPIVAGTAAITGADLMTGSVEAAEPGQMPQGSPKQLSEDQGLGLGEMAAIGAGTAVAAKPAWKYAVKPALKVLASPTAGLGFAGWSFVDNFNASKAETPEGKVYDALTTGFKFGETEAPGSAVGTDLLFPEVVKQTAKKLGVDLSKKLPHSLATKKGAQNALTALGKFLWQNKKAIALNPIGRAASAMTPVGLTLNAVALGKQLYTMGLEEQKRFEALSPEEQAEERAEQEEFGRMVEGAAEGGRVGFGKGTDSFTFDPDKRVTVLDKEFDELSLEEFLLIEKLIERGELRYNRGELEYNQGGRVGFSNGGDLMSKGVSWLLSPQNLERLKNNKGLVKQLTKIKALPSSVRLYLRNLAGVTDKITEDFFSKGELAEIKKRVAEAEANKSMGKKSISGYTTAEENAIGYRPFDRVEDEGKMSLIGAFNDPSTNIDMTLGQASFSKNKDGEIIVQDKHDFQGIEGSGYVETEYFPDSQYVKYKQVVPHRDTHDNLNEAIQDSKTTKDEKEWYESMKTLMPNKALSYETGETNKQLLKRAYKALQEGTIDPSKYARIIAGMHQGEGIPIKLNIGNITQKDKLKANPEFVNYLSTNPDIPTKIRTQAQEYLNVGGRVGFDKGSKPKSPSRRAFIKGVTALAALPIVGRFFKIGKVLEKAQPYLGPTVEKIKGMPEWFPGLVKKLFNEGEDVTKQMAYGERQIVKRGTLESGDDVDMIYNMDTGDVSINVTPTKGASETTSGAYNKEYSLDYTKSQADETIKGKKPPDEFGVNELEPRRIVDEVVLEGTTTTVDDAFSDLTELEAFAKNKTTKQIHKKKGTKPKDVPDYDDVFFDYDY